MKNKGKFLLAGICLFLLGISANAGETWVLLGIGIEPELQSAPKGSIAEKNGITGFGWLIDLQSIVKQDNLVFYHERGTLTDNNGNSIKSGESENIYLRIVNCNTRLMKFRENYEWAQPTKEHREIINYLCAERQVPKTKRGII
jgi:hypothetical protein